MQKNSIRQSPKQANQACPEPITIAMDLEDRTSRYGVWNSDGEVVQVGSVATAERALVQRVRPELNLS